MPNRRQTITGLFREGTTDRERDRAIRELADIDGVVQAGSLVPSVDIEPVRRMFYVTTSERADAASILRRIASQNLVESVAPAAERFAAAGGPTDTAGG